MKENTHMVSISSHTIVRNGMPFIGRVLEQVAPYMDEMLVTVSAKSEDGTLEEVERIKHENDGKIHIYIENQPEIKLMTEERQRHIDLTKTDWILHLDDDDYWTHDQLELCLNELDKESEMIAYSVNPYQLMDLEHYDWNWRNRYFSKFLRKTPGLHIKGNFPRDLYYDDDGKLIHCKSHLKNKVLPYRFYHLSYLKQKSFRTEMWADEFRHKTGKPIKLEQPLKL